MSRTAANCLCVVKARSTWLGSDKFLDHLAGPMSATICSTEYTCPKTSIYFYRCSGQDKLFCLAGPDCEAQMYGDGDNTQHEVITTLAH